MTAVWIIIGVGFGAVCFVVGALLARWRAVLAGDRALAAQRDVVEREAQTFRHQVAQHSADRQRLIAELEEERRALGEVVGLLEVERSVVADTRATVDRLRAERDGLRAETAKLRASASVSTRPSRLREVTVAGDALDDLLSRIALHQGIRGAVITDELGLVVATAGGELGEALAAFGRHIADEARRMRELLPIRDITQITVFDGDGAVIVVRPLPVAGHRLALVTIGGTGGTEGAAREVEAWASARAI